MKFTILLVALLLCLFAVPAMAQDQFVWIGGGIDQHNIESATFDFGWGKNIGEGKYIVTTMKMSDQYATVSEDFVQEVVANKYFTLAVIGGMGVTAGSGNTNFAFGGGPIFSLNLEPFSSKMKNFSVMAGAKIMNDSIGKDNSSMTRILTGLVYRF